MSASLTEGQTRALVIAERVTSFFSLVGIAFVLSTFAFSDRFRKPINRLIFFASFGNLGMNIATLVSENGPAAGQASNICQLQAFLIQM